MFTGLLPLISRKAFLKLLPQKSAKKTTVQARPKEPTSGQTVLIHIGKCGGALLRAVLRDSEIDEQLFPVHIAPPPFRSDLKYIIVARNPLTRVISAFNWRYKLVVIEENQRHRFPGEYDVLKRYGSINALGEALFDTSGVPVPKAHNDARIIHHIREDISFYLRELLGRCNPNQIKAVLMQETLDADINLVFGIQNTRRIHDNRSVRNLHALSNRARKNLIKFLHRDYEALSRLYAWGKIEKDTYQKALLCLDDD